MFSIHNFETLDSTNYKATEFSVGSAIVAEQQTEGHGRFKREWISSSGGLWFSVVLLPTRKSCEYTFIAALAIAKSLDIDVDIKWPNDILYKGKKLCGILTEIISSGNNVEKIIVGIGINVNNAPPEMGISLQEITNKKVDREKLLSLILENIEKLQTMNISTLTSVYKKKCSTIGKKVRVKTTQEVIEGTAIDIDEEGNLLLKNYNGIVRLTEGEATLL